MKTFHILPKDIFLSSYRCFSESHYIDLPDGVILICGNFKGKDHQDAFQQHPAIKTLPHPLSGGKIKQYFKQTHLDYLQSLGVTVTGTDSSWDLGEKLKSINRLMSLD